MGHSCKLPSPQNAELKFLVTAQARWCIPVMPVYGGGWSREGHKFSLGYRMTPCLENTGGKDGASLICANQEHCKPLTPLPSTPAPPHSSLPCRMPFPCHGPHALMLPNPHGSRASKHWQAYRWWYMSGSRCNRVWKPMYRSSHSRPCFTTYLTTSTRLRIWNGNTEALRMALVHASLSPHVLRRSSCQCWQRGVKGKSLDVITGWQQKEGAGSREHRHGGRKAGSHRSEGGSTGMEGGRQSTQIRMSASWNPGPSFVVNNCCLTSLICKMKVKRWLPCRIVVGKKWVCEHKALKTRWLYSKYSINDTVTTIPQRVQVPPPETQRLASVGMFCLWSNK